MKVIIRIRLLSSVAKSCLYSKPSLIADSFLNRILNLPSFSQICIVETGTSDAGRSEMCESAE